ncbi:MAG: hypothetical protein JO057_13545 [Chloroflexi bacterium]|nr:hypothetical protein [Chloroflexota bacterium]
MVAVVRPGNLPAPISCFIGRDAEVARLENVLARERIVTLTGPAGRGKTRLALELARRTAHRYADGIAWVELGTVVDEVGIAQAIAVALQLSQRRGQHVLQTVLGAFRECQALLIVDDCTAVARECVRVFEQLLISCPNLKILATSVSHLDAEGWCHWSVPPLYLGTEEPCADDDAIRLFMDRAEAADQRIVLDDRTLDLVASICARLGGEPLAIKRAAGRLDLLALEEILEQDDLLDLGYASDAPPGGLLPTLERLTMARLAIFPSSWTREAAEFVISDLDDPDNPTGVSSMAPRIAAPNVRTLLQSLYRRSLVDVIQMPEGGKRYRLHPLHREYYRTLAVDEAELQALRERRLQWVEALAEKAGTALWSQTQAQMLERIQLEYETIQSVLRGITSADAWRGLRIVVALWRFWEVRGQWAQARSHLEMLLALATPITQERAPALTLLGYLATLQGDYDSARNSLRDAQALLENDSGSIDAIRLEVGWGFLQYCRGDSSAVSRLSAAAAMAEQLEERVVQSAALRMLAAADSRAAPEHYRKSLALDRALGDTWGIAFGQLRLAQHELEAGRPDCVESAGERLRESLRLRWELRHWRGVAACIEDLAWVAVKENRHEFAACLFGGAERLRRLADAPLAAAIGNVHEHYLTLMRANCSSDIVAREWAAGQKLATRELVCLALGDAAQPSPYMSGPTPRPTSPLAENRFVQEDGLWTIDFEGTLVRLSDRKGLHDLAYLLGRPEVEISVLELAARGDSQQTTVLDSEQPLYPEGDLGPALDDQAVREIRDRIAELKADIAEAEARADAERVKTARDEHDRITRLLRSAHDIHGQPRPMKDPLERARQRIKDRIDTAILAITRVHAPLGRHLENAIHKGYDCSYRPERPTRWQI